LAELLTLCLDMQRPALAARGQTLTQALPAKPVWVQADPARLQQVINNLLSNANKYTLEGGSVHVAVTVEQRFAAITVRDNGIGIEPGLLPRVFDLFEQGQRALDRNQGGLGVGLTLVQRLVKLHGGRVEAHSAGEGLGAEFRVYLPCLQMAAAPAVDTGAAASGRAKVSRRVLIIEDNSDVAETTAAMLSMVGHTLCCARDGAQGLQLAQEFEPEIVLLDVGLPRLDGYQVARHLRQLPQMRNALLIALTGYGMPADRQRGREAGFDHHLLKPADPGELMTLIDSWAPPAAEEAQLDERRAATLYAFKRP
jgi:CheY-like chemotaxis protein/anti-sigma regulatory factor (Ser/Thr protein kinase)